MTQIGDAGADLGRRLSYEIVMLHHAVSDRLGLTITDHKYLDLIAMNAPISPGRIVELTGLTSGAVTGLIDRLERLGFVERTVDSDDRRARIVDVNPDRMSEIGELMAPMGRRVGMMLGDFSPDELGMVARYLEGLVDAVAATRADIESAAVR